MSDSLHEPYIQRCFDLAQMGGSKVRPNPKVGAVLVHKDKILAEGFHAFAGGPHAEVNCLNNVRSEDQHLIRQSTLYVSLEPCNFHGKTPACTELILKNGIPRVVVSAKDPNPAVNGRGIEMLTKHGVEVFSGVLDQAGMELISYFAVNQKAQRPYIILKVVKSADHFIGQQGKRIWLSNHFSRVLSHKWRSEVDGIMVGTNTVFNDNPSLDNRLYKGGSPSRIILDRENRIPHAYNVRNERQRTYIVNSLKNEMGGSNHEYLKADFGDPDFLPDLMHRLYQKGLYIILVEGGASLIRSFLRKGLWDEARVITVGKVLGEGISSPNITGRLVAEEDIAGDKLQVIRPLAPDF